MTTKQFSILIAVVVILSVLGFTVFAASAQSSASSPVILGVQTSMTGCTWPTAYATVSNGMAFCPLNLTTGPALAIAVNGGAFVQIPMTTAAAGVTSFNGRTGAVTLTDADVTGTGVKATTTATTTLQ